MATVNGRSTNSSRGSSGSSGSSSSKSSSSSQSSGKTSSRVPGPFSEGNRISQGRARHVTAYAPTNNKADLVDLTKLGMDYVIPSAQQRRNPTNDPGLRDNAIRMSNGVSQYLNSGNTNSGTTNEWLAVANDFAKTSTGEDTKNYWTNVVNSLETQLKNDTEFETAQAAAAQKAEEEAAAKRQAEEKTALRNSYNADVAELQRLQQEGQTKSQLYVNGIYVGEDKQVADAYAKRIAEVQARIDEETQRLGELGDTYTTKSGLGKAWEIAKGIEAGSGTQFASTVAGAADAMLGSHSQINDVNALYKGFQSGAPVGELLSDFANLEWARAKRDVSGIYEKGWNTVGGLINKLGGNVDTENDAFTSQYNRAAQEEYAKAREDYYGLTGEPYNPFTAINERRQEKLEQVTDYWAKEFESDPVAQTINKYGVMAGAQLPQAALAVAMALGGSPTGGAAILQGGLAAGTTEGLGYIAALNSTRGMQQLAVITQQVAGNLASNPQFWAAYGTEMGSAYNQAIAEGADPDTASAYAAIYGGISAIIELGGGTGSAGLESLPAGIRDMLASGNKTQAAWMYLGSILSELGEEEAQGFFERGLKSGYTDVPIYSDDKRTLTSSGEWIDTPEGKANPNALINPSVMGETAKDTAIVTALLGAGQSATMGGLNAIANRNVQESAQNAATPAGQAAGGNLSSNPVIAEIQQRGNVTVEDMQKIRNDPELRKAFAEAFGVELEAPGTNPTYYPTAEQRATQASEDAKARVQEILANPAGENGRISNTQARTILTDDSLRQAFQEITGVEPAAGTDSSARTSVKSAAATYLANQNNTEAQPETTAPAAQETAPAETAAPATAPAPIEHTAIETSTPYVITSENPTIAAVQEKGRITPNEATRIRNNKELRAEFENTYHISLEGMSEKEATKAIIAAVEKQSQQEKAVAAWESEHGTIPSARPGFAPSENGPTRGERAYQRAQQAKNDIISMLLSGTMSDQDARKIASDKMMLTAFEDVTGISMQNKGRTALNVQEAFREAVENPSDTLKFYIDNAAGETHNNPSEVNTNGQAAGSLGENQGGVPGAGATSGTVVSSGNGYGGVPGGSGVVLLSDTARQQLQARGITVVDLQPTTDYAAFSYALDAARDADEAHGWAVTPKSVEDLNKPGNLVLMSADGSTGLVITPDGDIEGVFKNKNTGVKGSTKSTIPQAIANGGTKLDCYGAGLVDIYAQYGFIPVARVKFNPHYANPGWRPNKGSPDVYVMMHNGDSADTVIAKNGDYDIWTPDKLEALPEMEYDAAMKYRDSLLEQQNAQKAAEANPEQGNVNSHPEATNATESGLNAQNQGTEENQPGTPATEPEAAAPPQENAQPTENQQAAQPRQAQPPTEPNPVDMLLGTEEKTESAGGRRRRTPHGNPTENTDAEFNALVDEYGAIEEGENPARDINVPKKDATGKKVGEGVRTIMEAGATPEERLGNLKAAVVNGDFGHVPVTNDARSTRAARKVATNGWSRSVAEFLGAVDSGKVDADVVALGAHLLNEAGNSPEATGREYIELAIAYNEAVHGTGQALAAGRILKTLTPEGKLYGIQKTVDKINDRISKENEKRRPGNKKPTMKLNENLAEEYLKAETEEERNAVHDKIIKDLASQAPNTVRDKFTALRYLNMLGNFKTQARNVLGNVAMMTVNKVKNETVSVIEGIATGLGANIERTYKGLYGADRFQAAFEDYKSDEQLKKVARGESKYTDVAKQAESEILDAKKPFSDNNPVGILLNAYSAATNAAMDYGDRIFVALNYADALAGYMNAHNITAEQWRQMVNDPSKADDVDAARQFAIQQAQEATFRDTNKLSRFATTFDRNWGKLKLVTQGVVPFRKTTANVLARMEEYGPLGLINTAYDYSKMKSGETTASDVIDDLSKTLTGSGIMALGFVARAAGKVRTKAKDDNEERLAKLRGQQDYAIEVETPAGRHKSLTLDWLTPAAASFFMGSELYDIVQNGEITPAEAMTVLTSFTNPMLQMSLLSGVNDALSNLSDFEGDNSAVLQFVLNSAWSYLTQGISNTMLGQAEQYNEDYRQTYYTDKDNSWFTPSTQKKLAKLFNKTPGYDYQAADYIDAWGRKQENDENKGARAFNTFVNPAYVSDLDKKATAADDFIEDLYQFGKKQTEQDSFPNVVPKSPSRYTTVNGKQLSPEEYDEYATIKGQESLKGVTEFSQSEQINGMDKYAQAETVQEIYEYAEFLAASRIAEARGEEYEDDRFKKYNDIKDLDDPIAFLATNEGYRKAMDDENYDSIDALIQAASSGDLSPADYEYYKQHLNGFEKLYSLGDSGLGSKRVLEFANDVKTLYESEHRENARGSDYIRVAGSGKYTPKEADLIMAYAPEVSQESIEKYQERIRYQLDAAGMSNQFYPTWSRIVDVVNGDMSSDDFKKWVDKSVPLQYRQEIKDTCSNYAKDRHEAGKTVTGIYESVRAAGYTPQEALAFYNAVDANYNGSMAKGEYKKALKAMFGAKQGEIIWNNMKERGVQYVTGRF